VPDESFGAAFLTDSISFVIRVSICSFMEFLKASPNLLSHLLASSSVSWAKGSEAAGLSALAKGMVVGWIDWGSAARGFVRKRAHSPGPAGFPSSGASAEVLTDRTVRFRFQIRFSTP